MHTTAVPSEPDDLSRDAGRRPFNLTRWFLALSFVCIALTSAASAALLSRFLTDQFVARDAAITMEFVNSIVAAEDAAELFQVGDPAAVGRKLEALFLNIAAIPDVLRANLFARDGSILWSSNRELIGVTFNTNPELDRAFLGETVTEAGVVGGREKAEHAFLEGEGRHFVESYLPVYDRHRREVVGVVEVYKSSTDLTRVIGNARRLVWLSAALGGLVLYGALFWIIRRADTVITSQQKRLLDSEKMAVIGEMASAVAHGLRNPLAAIRSSAELGLEEEPNAPLRESLNDIVTQSDRLENWIREFLTGARPVSLDFQPVRLNELLADTAAVFSGEMEKRAIAFELAPEADLPEVDGNPPALRQVFNSLLANALEAMPGGGSLRLATASTGGGAGVEITVSDTGKGIPPELRERVFQPFVTSKGSGLGVGLSLARRIIERHQGTLELDESEGGGTVARVRLPARG